MVIKLRRSSYDQLKNNIILQDGEIILLYNEKDGKYINGNIKMGNGKDEIKDLPNLINSYSEEKEIKNFNMLIKLENLHKDLQKELKDLEEESKENIINIKNKANITTIILAFTNIISLILGIIF